jgi:hypothetical protein
MDSNPLGTRGMTRGLKAHTVLDTAGRHYITPMRKTGGKLRKDDQSCKGVQDYLAEKYVWHINNRRKGRYEPSQIVRNFFRS